MWLIKKGDRGLPITYEREYVNQDENSIIRTINIHQYVSKRLVLEILCKDNDIGLEMTTFFKPLIKYNDLDHLHSLVSFEPIVLNQQAIDELRILLVQFGSKYFIPQAIINDIYSQITTLSPSYSYHFFKAHHAVATLKEKTLVPPLETETLYKGYVSEIKGSLVGYGFKTLGEDQRVELIEFKSRMKRG